ncbi:MAG: MFS transporter [Hyphomonadaceae bacterium]
MANSTQALGARPLQGAWAAVAILFLLFCLSYLDRLIVALLAQPISQSLALSDTELGLLFGLGFGVVYAISGLPIAHLIDRTHRVRLVVVGVTLWSVCTILSGFAAGYWDLLAFRSGVAIGEAVLSPAAISIIGDLFPREKRTLPTAIYTSVGTFMTAGAFVAGGAALDLATMLSANVAMEPWRLCLVIVGAPGLLLAPILLIAIREPKRIGEARTEEGKDGEELASAAQAWAYVKSHGWLYGGLFIGMATFGILTYAYVGWITTVLIRAYGATPAHAGYIFGTAGLIGGVLGCIIWPTVAKYWSKHWRPSAIVLLLGLGTGLAGVSVLVAGLARSEAIVVCAIAAMPFFGAVSATLPPIIIQYVAPGRVRARLMAANLMASTLIGFTIGPALGALIAEHVFTGPFALASAMAVTVVIFAPLSFLFFMIARANYQRAFDEAVAREGAAPA